VEEEVGIRAARYAFHISGPSLSLQKQARRYKIHTLSDII
jgi:hypothetical protein